MCFSHYYQYRRKLIVCVLHIDMLHCNQLNVHCSMCACSLFPYPALDPIVIILLSDQSHCFDPIVLINTDQSM